MSMIYRDQNLAALLDEAPRAVGYWGTADRTYGADGVASLVVTDRHEGPDLLTVTRKDAARACARIARGEVKVPNRMRRKVAMFRGFLDTKDGLYLAQLEGEADALDCIVQVALFGEVIYG